MKKYLVLAASVIMQMVLGGVYAWSAVGRALREAYGLSSVQSEILYGLAVGLFPVVMLVTGRLIKIWGPRTLSLISAALFTLTYLAAWQSGGDFLWLVATLGVGLGVAVGFGYVCPLTTAVKWFPENKGLVTGVAVFGFGGGAIISANVFNHFLGQGMPILELFLWYGLIGGGLVLLSALGMSVPETSPVRAGAHSPTPVRFVHDPLYWKLAFGIFTGTLGGLVLIGKVTSLAGEFGFEVWGALYVSLLAAGNALGRLAWGALNDRLPKRIVSISLASVAASALFLLVARFHPVALGLGFFAVGFTFGGSLVLYAARTERSFGSSGLAEVYPFVFIWYGLAALIGPVVGGWLHDSLNDYGLVITVAGVLPLLGLGVWHLKTPHRV